MCREPPESAVNHSNTKNRTNGMSPSRKKNEPIETNKVMGRYMMYARMMVTPDLTTCSPVLLKSRDSRVLGLTSIGMLAMARRLLPAWMIVSMQ